MRRRPEAARLFRIGRRLAGTLASSVEHHATSTALIVMNRCKCTSGQRAARINREPTASRAAGEERSCTTREDGNV